MARSRNSKPWDIVVDVLHRKNRDVYMPGLDMHLHGEVRLENFRSLPSKAVAMIGGVLPRHRLHVQLDGRIIRVVDRIGEPENKQIADKLKDLTKTERYVMYEFGKFEEEQHHALTEQQFRTFLWYLRRFVDNGQMRIVEGYDKLPTADDMRSEKKPIVLCDKGGFKAAKGETPFWQLETSEDADEAEQKAVAT